MSIIEHRFDSREALTDSLYALILETYADSSPSTLLLSGGSTPGPLYRKLSEATLDWSAVSIALVDDRWVEPQHDASNENLIRQTLLRNRAARAAFTGMKTSHDDPFEADAECNRRYAGLPEARLCLLGMGNDGHTASLFPEAEGLEAALVEPKWCAPIRARRSEVTGDYLERMTLTRWALLQSQKLVLLITGDDKWQTYRRALQNGASEQMPVSLLLQQDDVEIEVYWAP